MKLALVCGCSVALYAASSNGQTNACVEATPHFFLPPVPLRLEARPEPSKAAPTASVSLTPVVAPSTGLELSTAIDDGEFHSKVVRRGEFYLTRVEPRPDGGIARVLDGIFTPEVVHIGKIPVSGSIVTAIKRKNPLCLLNPIVFQVSW
jgi:hypothetical protein